MTRDLAAKINDRFGEETLVIPEAQIKDGTAVVPGLDGQKMSKSYNNTLPLCGAQKALRKQVMKITTDSTPVEEPKATEGSNVIALYKLFANETDIQQRSPITTPGALATVTLSNAFSTHTGNTSPPLEPNERS